jgi:hypothetical protein
MVQGTGTWFMGQGTFLIVFLYLLDLSKEARKQMQSNQVLNEGKKRLLGLTFPLHSSRRNKRWKILQDFFETNDHGSSLGKELKDLKNNFTIYIS